MRQQDYLCHERQTQVRGLRHYVKERVQAHSTKGSRIGWQQKRGDEPAQRKIRTRPKARRASSERYIRTNTEDKHERCGRVRSPPRTPPPLPRRLKNQRKYTAVYGAWSNYRPGKVAKLPTCKVPTLQGQLQHCKTFQASLLNCRALARLQNCQPARAAKLQPLPTLPTCQSFNTAGFPLAARSVKLQIRLRNPNCKAPTLQAHPTARLFKPAKQSAKLRSKVANYNLLLTQHRKTSQARLPNYRPGGCKIANPICNQLHQH